MGETDHERKVFENQVRKHREQFPHWTEKKTREEVKKIAQTVERNREAQKKPRLR